MIYIDTQAWLYVRAYAVRYSIKLNILLSFFVTLVGKAFVKGLFTKAEKRKASAAIMI